MPATTGIGTYYLGAIADYTNPDRVPETDETNNAVAGGQIAIGELLTVVKSGSGGGTVTSIPPGIDCGSVCSYEYPIGSLVSLSATGDTGFALSGWSGGGCSGTGICDVTMTSDITVNATFDGLAVITPNGGEVVPSGSTYTIEWGPENIAGVDSFEIQRSTDGGSSWNTIIDGLPSTATSYDWAVPTHNKNKNNYMIRVKAYDAGGSGIGADKSDNTFTVEVLKVITPNGGEVIPTGDQVPSSGDEYEIAWTLNGTSTTVDRIKLFYSIDDGATWTRIITIFPPIPSTWLWEVPTFDRNKGSSRVKVGAYDSSNSEIISNKSDDVFLIEVVKLTAPNGGEVYTSGEVQTITWDTNTTVASVDSVLLQYTKNGGTTWIDIDTVQGDPRTYDWTVPDVNAEKPESKVKIKLRKANGDVIGVDASDDYITIRPAQ